MQSLIPLIFLVAGAAIFYAGYRVGNKEMESLDIEDVTYNTPQNKTLVVDNLKVVPIKEEEETANRFYK